MIKKIRYESLVYDTLFDTLIGDALRDLIFLTIKITKYPLGEQT
jgi:hypothetical protein